MERESLVGEGKTGSEQSYRHLRQGCNSFCGWFSNFMNTLGMDELRSH